VAKFWMRFTPGKRNSCWYWLLVALLTVLAVAPLTYPGFFQVHSGFLPAFNAANLVDAPHWGRLADPVRGDGRLPYLLVWPFLQLSGSGVVAVKLGYALAFVLGALGTYAWTCRWLGPRGGVLAAVVYTYLPWHVSTVYVRGAYAEAWLWAMLPFTLWAVDQLAQQRFLAALAIGLPSMATSGWAQPGLVALYLPVLAAYNVVITRKGQRLILRFAGAIACLFFALWLYVGPAAPEAPLPFAAHFLYPFQILSAVWGFGISVPGWADGMSFQLGLVAVGLSVVAVVLWVAGRSERSGAAEGSRALLSGRPAPLGRALWFWLVILAVLVFLTLSPSAFLWRISGASALLTYPWQLLTLAGLPLAFLAGAVIRLDERLAETPAWAGLLALTIVASYAYLAPRFTQLDPGPKPFAMVQPVGAKAPQIALLDYQILPPTEITPTLTLTLTWQAMQPIAEDYTVFVHVLTSGDEKAAQRDSYPCDGECPTRSWLPGEIIVDRHELTLAPEAPPGPYRLAVGLYLLHTGERAAVVGRDDQMVFFHVP
jgi:hypothetical protein